MMEGQKYDGVNRDDLYYVLQIIGGNKYPDREVDVEADEDKKGVDAYVVYNEDE